MSKLEQLYKAVMALAPKDVHKLGNRLIERGDKAMHIAHLLAQRGETARLLAVLQARSELIRSIDSQYYTILHYAASGTSPETAVELAKKFPYMIHSKGTVNGDNFFHLLAHHGVIVKAMADSQFGPLLPIRNRYGQSILHIAALYAGDNVALAVAEDYTHMLAWVDVNNQTALHYAAKENKPDLLLELAMMSSHLIAERDSTGQTCVHLIAAHGDRQTAQALVDLYPAALEVKRYDGVTANTVLFWNMPETVAQLQMGENNSGEKFYRNFELLRLKTQGNNPGIFCRKLMTAKEATTPMEKLVAKVNSTSQKFDNIWLIKGQHLDDHLTPYSQEQRAILEACAAELYSYYLGMDETSNTRLIKGRPTHFGANGAQLTVGVKLHRHYKSWESFLKDNQMQSPVTRNRSTGEVLLAGKPVQGVARAIFVSHMLGNLDINAGNVGFVPVTFKDGREGYECRVIDYDWSFVFNRKGYGTHINDSKDCLLSTEALLKFANTNSGGRCFNLDPALIDQRDLTNTAIHYASLSLKPMQDICDKYEAWLEPYRWYGLDNQREDRGNPEITFVPMVGDYVATMLTQRHGCLVTALKEARAIEPTQAMDRTNDYIHSRNFEQSNDPKSWREYMDKRMKNPVPNLLQAG